MTQMKEGSYLPLLLGLGLIGSNFFSLVLLSRSGDSLPNLASLATTENSSSQMQYKKDEKGLDVVITHNMHSPKTVLFSSEKSKWNGKTDYTRKEYVAHKPGENAELAAEYLQCIKNKGSAESQGEIVGTSLVTATPAASTLSNIPIIGWIAGAAAVKKAGQLGKDIGGDFVDC
tara:strand:+ start:4607 stop:5128 length:522 start_codon:yes stop_codon:yes gene_type:complete